MVESKSSHPIIHSRSSSGDRAILTPLEMLQSNGNGNGNNNNNNNNHGNEEHASLMNNNNGDDDKMDHITISISAPHGVAKHCLTMKRQVNKILCTKSRLIKISCIVLTCTLIYNITPSLLRMDWNADVRREKVNAILDAHLQSGGDHVHVMEVGGSNTGSPWPSTLGWDVPLTNIKCRTTKFYPFTNGCPSNTCAKRRTDVGKDVPLYRTEVFWDFGQIQTTFIKTTKDSQQQQQSNNKPIPKVEISYDNATDYELYHMYPRASPDFARQFLHLREDLIHSLSPPSSDSTTTTIPTLDIRLPKHIYMTLFYFCCLTSSEIQTLRQVLQQWLDKTDFSYSNLSFDHVECWRERHDAIANILVANDDTQRMLLRQITNDGYDQLKKAGIPIPVRREDQIPFHIPLAVIHPPIQQQQNDGSSDGDDNEDDDVGPYVVRVAGSSNHIMERGRMNGVILQTNATFRPSISAKMTCHANCDAEKKMNDNEEQQEEENKDHNPNKNKKEEEEEEVVVPKKKLPEGAEVPSYEGLLGQDSSSPSELMDQEPEQQNDEDDEEETNGRHLMTTTTKTTTSSSWWRFLQ